MTISSTGFANSQEVEAAFYKAFANCDAAAMAALWARDDVICVHPGSNAIIGHEAVIRSWRYIFDGAELPDIQVHLVKTVSSENLAVHIIEEHISTGERSSAALLVTNVYRKFDTGWLMVEHHGSVIHSASESHTVQ